MISYVIFNFNSLAEIIYIKCLVHYLAHNRCLANGSHHCYYYNNYDNYHYNEDKLYKYKHVREISICGDASLVQVVKSVRVQKEIKSFGFHLYHCL